LLGRPADVLTAEWKWETLNVPKLSNAPESQRFAGHCRQAERKLRVFLEDVIGIFQGKIGEIQGTFIEETNAGIFANKIDPRCARSTQDLKVHSAERLLTLRFITGVQFARGPFCRFGTWR